MPRELDNYLLEIKTHLHLTPAIEKRVLGEFFSHITEKTDELKRQGRPPDSSLSEALRSFGRPRAVARMMYEAHSRGSWQDSLVTAIPHLLLSALFFGHFWRHPLLVPFAFSAIVGITALGWWNGRPNWIFSWVGYSVFPLLVGAFSLERVVTRSVVSIISGDSTVWSWLLLLPVVLFYSVSLCLIISTVYKIARRDWVLASVMLVPQPILGFWLFKIQKVGSFFSSSAANLYRWDYPMATVFLLLGITLAVFIRLRQRLLKAGALILVGTLAGSFIVLTIWGELSIFALLIVTTLLLLLYVSPSLIQSTGRGEASDDKYHYLPV